MGGSKAGLHNQNFDFNIWPTVGFVDSAKLANVLEVDLVTGMRRERAGARRPTLDEGLADFHPSRMRWMFDGGRQAEHAGRYCLASFWSSCVFVFEWSSSSSSSGPVIS